MKRLLCIKCYMEKYRGKAGVQITQSFDVPSLLFWLCYESKANVSYARSAMNSPGSTVGKKVNT